MTWLENAARLITTYGETRDAALADHRHLCEEWLTEYHRLMSEPHLIRFTNGGWVIQHPLSCRLGGTLFDCPYTWDMGDIGHRGIYELLVDDDNYVLGRRVDD